MKRKRCLVIFVSLFLGCIAVMDYPFAARIYNEHVQGKAVTDYENSIDKMDQEMWQEEFNKAEWYNNLLISGLEESLEDPFGKTIQSQREYEEILNTGKEGVMGWIEIPEIQVALPIYHGTSENVLQKGAGHLEGSSLPIGGESTHTVISAHRGLPGKKMFTDLDQLETGTIFYLHVLDKILAYQVSEIETVKPDETGALAIRKGEDLASLITCTPYGINTHRMYVHGKRIPYEEAIRKGTVKNTIKKRIREYWWIWLSGAMLAWMGLLIRQFCRQKEMKVGKKGRKKRKE